MDKNRLAADFLKSLISKRDTKELTDIEVQSDIQAAFVYADEFLKIISERQKMSNSDRNNEDTKYYLFTKDWIKQVIPPYANYKWEDKILYKKQNNKWIIVNGIEYDHEYEVRNAIITEEWELYQSRM